MDNIRDFELGTRNSPFLKVPNQYNKTEVINGCKKCTKCGVSKPLCQFNVCSNHSSGRKTVCRECSKQEAREYHKAVAQDNTRRLKRNDYYRKKRPVRLYGMTYEEVLKEIEKRDNRCDICGKKACGKWGKLVIDHDHKTDKIRGFLCSKCNIGIGQFNDDVLLLLNAVNYISTKS